MIGDYFYLDESPVYHNKFLIKSNIEKMPFPNGTLGSFSVLVARLLNLSYADYLRYARDRLGAELTGKNNKYVIAYFDDTKEVKALVKLLNKRMEYIMFEQEHPYELIQKEDGTWEKIPFMEEKNEDTSSDAGTVS